MAREGENVNEILCELCTRQMNEIEVKIRERLIKKVKISSLMQFSGIEMIWGNLIEQKGGNYNKK